MILVPPVFLGRFQARVMEDPSQLSRVMPYGAEGAAGEHRTTVLAYCGIGTVHAFDVELVTNSLGRNKYIITTLRFSDCSRNI